ncbi:hypothetical protein RHGRI_018889 [Rhododendron griersonianum]|uniref:non-specific serine/threonine protein kinase n=1 Tax=Rhododendron griersonianum TaxID=479676 RepID=A0AAV6K363_9ERIC|nr:hypothetical protein RHGRI_018889 [Rhododendron griersonianum]
MAGSAISVYALAFWQLLCFFFVLGLVHMARAQNQTSNATTPPSEVSALNFIFSEWGLSAPSNQWNISGGEPCSGAAIDSTPFVDPNYNPFIKCECDATTCHIVQLKVFSLSVFGVIPDELWSLTYLWNIDLRQNYLTGTLSPSIGNLTRMQYLSVGINSLSGQVPKELGKLTDLRSLAFDMNNFSGSLPLELGNLTKLEQLYIASSGISGVIPSTFSSLQNLQTMWASDIDLTGSIPEFIGNLSNLKGLRFQGNSFGGAIPSSFSKLTLMENLRISDLSNGSSSLAFLKDMKSLNVLILRNNNISGVIPSNIGDYRSLSQLDLSFNNLTGQIPDSLFNLSSLSYLFLGNNKLTGPLPAQKSTSLLNVDVSYNELSGSFPSWISQQDLQLNLVANDFTIESSNNRVLPSGWSCLQRNFPCYRNPPIYYNLSIKCGGPQITSRINQIVYERDNEALGPATYYVTGTKRWAVSNVGRFGENNNAQYTSNSSSQIADTLDSELFQTARISAGSLRYYGLGLENGYYNVSLQFAEISILNPTNWRSLGRRVFDIYIQAWHLHKSNHEVELVDANLSEFNEEEVKRVIGVALLCTQTSPQLRPSMSRAVAMLSGDIEVSSVISPPGYMTDWKLDEATGFITTDTPASKDEYSHYSSSTNTSMVTDPDLTPINATRPMLQETIEEGHQVQQMADWRLIEAIQWLIQFIKCKRLSSEKEVIPNCSILAAVGQKMASTPGVCATLFNALAKLVCFFFVPGLVDMARAQTSNGTTTPSEVSALNSIFGEWGLSAKLNQWNISGEPCSGAAIDTTSIESTNGDYNPGIKCQCDGTTCHITQLKVYALSVFGVIPDELWTLTYLTNLDLRQNYLTGTLSPSIGNLTRMQYLSVGINALSGQVPKELGKLTDLRSLSFSTNNFSGTLPLELGNLTKLEQLYIISSGVSGAIPSTYASLQNLQQVRFQGNSFGGVIPSTFSKLTLMENLRIGDISNGSSSLAFLNDMKSLNVLILRNNNISGSIPSNIGDFRSLSQLFLGNNKLTGPLPAQKSTSLLNVDVSYNELSGSFPSWINQQDLQLNLVANNFTIESSNDSVLPSGLSCLQRNFPCYRNSPLYYNLSIKCGGPQITSRIDQIVYERDDEALGPATYYVTSTKRWAVSNVGRFGENNNARYTSNSSSQITDTLDSELFQTARISAGSLRYYGLGLENGNYNVSLQFAEISILNPPDWRSLGRRIFDIYVQAWHLHESHHEVELVDANLSEFNEKEVKRVIGVALLCTQTSPQLRPSMSRAVAMLSGDIEVSSVISRPGYMTEWKLDDATGFITPDTPASKDKYSHHSSSTNTSMVADPDLSPINATRPMLQETIGEVR